MSEQSTGGRLYGHEALVPDGSASIQVSIGTASASHTVTVVHNSLYRVATYGTVDELHDNYVALSWDGGTNVGTNTFALINVHDQVNVHIPAGTTTIYAQSPASDAGLLMTRQSD